MTNSENPTQNDVIKFLDDLPEKTVVISADGQRVAHKSGGVDYPWHRVGALARCTSATLALWGNGPWKVLTPAPVEIPADEAMSILGEGIHAGLRKCSDAPEAPDLWLAISNSGRAWSDALSYAVWGLEYMGLVKKEK